MTSPTSSTRRWRTAPCKLWRSYFVLAFFALGLVGASPLAQGQGLSAGSAQHLASRVDRSIGLVSSVSQLVATWKSLKDQPEDDFSTNRLRVPLAALAGLNQDLSDQLISLRQHLGTLFLTGRSSDLAASLKRLKSLPSGHHDTLAAALSGIRDWPNRCTAMPAMEVRMRYKRWSAYHRELRRMEEDMANLAEDIFELREKRSWADGVLAGLEEVRGRVRSPRPGEEYELARYIDTSLFRWELLRTKVAHHLAAAYSEGKESILAEREKASTEQFEAAESSLAELETKLTEIAEAHKRLGQKKKEHRKNIHAMLKILFEFCEDVKRYENGTERIVSEGQNPVVTLQAAEEYSRFLEASFDKSLPQMVEFLQDVLEPYLDSSTLSYVLPDTWQARPRVNRWWEWLEAGSKREPQLQVIEEDPDPNEPLSESEFGKQFAKAKRQFSVRITGSKPIVMAYLFWDLLEEVLGSAPSSPPPPNSPEMPSGPAQSEAVLSLPMR